MPNYQVKHLFREDAYHNGEFAVLGTLIAETTYQESGLIVTEDRGELLFDSFDGFCLCQKYFDRINRVTAYDITSNLDPKFARVIKEYDVDLERQYKVALRII